MGLNSFKEVGQQAYQEGQHWYTSFRKVSGLASQQGTVIDLSMAPGSPRPNYYMGTQLAATQFNGAHGIWHGGDVSPKTKHLHILNVFSGSASYAPGDLYLLDYLLFYPLIEMDETGDQFFDNTVTLPRYTDGKGVQAFIVATNPYVGSALFYITYTNQNGESGRISRIMTCNTYGFIGTIIHSGPQAGMHGTFVNLAPGDTGIRSVESITFLSPNGGLAALVLCKRIAKAALFETTAWSEWDFLTMKREPTRIYDGAYLNFIAAVNGSVSAVPLIGEISVIWN
jgi:hypothetical protein